MLDRFDPPPPRNPIAADAIETVFTPGNAARAMEYAALDEVIAARRADTRSFAPQENPYRIEYAVYNLTDEGVIARLTEAARAGVQVQVLVDSGNIGPSKWWNTLVEDLTAAGFSYAPSNKKLTEEERRNTQLIGIDMPGLFHLKSRYFAYPDPTTGELKETLLTGSHNPETIAHRNDESMHRIKDRTLIQQYVSAIEALRDGKPVQNVWDDSSAVNVLFTAPKAEGPRPVDKIFELIEAERELILLSVFTLRNISGPDQQKLVDRLVAARERGVKVAVVTDRKMSDAVDFSGKREGKLPDDKTEDLLQAAGIPTYEAINRSGIFNAMHLKAGLFGLTNMKVVTDAGNWTAAVMGSPTARAKNADSLLFIDSGRLDQNHTAERYLGEFVRLLRKYGPQNPAQPDAEALIAELQRHPSWPKVKVDFSVVAKTHLGQDVYIVGNTRALGGWGADGPGLKLDTDPRTYPNWRSAQVELPLGARLEYKVVKRGSDGSVEWEAGQNAVLIVDPTEAPSTDEIRVADAFGTDG